MKQGVSAIDSLSNSLVYTDTGCEVSSHCLSCPLTLCKYDNPALYRKELKEYRNQNILDALSKMTSKDVSKRFGISLRTVCRIKSDKY